SACAVYHRSPGIQLVGRDTLAAEQAHGHLGPSAIEHIIDKAAGDPVAAEKKGIDPGESFRPGANEAHIVDHQWWHGLDGVVGDVLGLELIPVNITDRARPKFPEHFQDIHFPSGWSLHRLHDRPPPKK